MINEDAAAAKELVCGKTDSGLMYDGWAGNTKPVTGRIELLSDERAAVDITLAGGSDEGIPASFVRRDGAWCVEY